jgi:hypothetical protein
MSQDLGRIDKDHLTCLMFSPPLFSFNKRLEREVYGRKAWLQVFSSLLSNLYSILSLTYSEGQHY